MDENQGVESAWVKWEDNRGRKGEKNYATVGEARERYNVRISDPGTVFAQFGARTTEGAIVLGEYRPN